MEKIVYISLPMTGKEDTIWKRYNDNCFCQFFTFLAYKPTPLLRVSAPTGKITHKALQQDCKNFFWNFQEC